MGWVEHLTLEVREEPRILGSGRTLGDKYSLEEEKRTVDRGFQETF